MILSPKKVFVRGSLEIGFISMRHNENPTQGVNLKIPSIDRLWEVFMWELVIHTFRSLRNSVMSPDCDFFPLDQIVIVSLDGFRRRVENIHITQIVPRIDETTVMLECLHHITARGTPLL
jgi:hypothetical protein